MFLLCQLFNFRNREKKGESDYWIIIEWLWEGETKLSNSWKGETKNLKFLEV